MKNGSVFIVQKNYENYITIIITYQPKAFENPNFNDIKSVITEYPKTSHKSSKTIRRAEKVGS